MRANKRKEAQPIELVSVPIHSSPQYHRLEHGATSLMHSLSTTFDGVYANDGVMFDIRSSPTLDVDILSLSFITDVTGSCDVQVFTRKGSHEYFEEEPAGWTMIVNWNTDCLGSEEETVIIESEFTKTDNSNLQILKGESRAFYIRVDGVKLIYSGTSNFKHVFVEDSHIQILEGTGIEAYFQGYTVPRMWNGSVNYLAKTNSVHNFNSCSRFLQVGSTYGGNDSTKNYGVMFDVKAKTASDLTIQGLAFYTNTQKEVQYDIYTIPVGFEYGKGSVAAWTLLASGIAKSEIGEPIVVTGNNFQSVNIPAQETHGFFITLRSETLLYHTTSLSVGSTFIQNDDMIVTVGAGVGDYPLGNKFYNSRGLSGQVLYSSNNSCNFDTTTAYLFVVHYPKDWTSGELYEEIEFQVTSTLLDLLTEDEYLISLQEIHELDFSSVVAFYDVGDLGKALIAMLSFFISSSCSS